MQAETLIGRGCSLRFSKVCLFEEFCHDRWTFEFPDIRGGNFDGLACRARNDGPGPGGRSPRLQLSTVWPGSRLPAVQAAGGELPLRRCFPMQCVTPLRRRMASPGTNAFSRLQPTSRSVRPDQPRWRTHEEFRLDTAIVAELRPPSSPAADSCSDFPGTSLGRQVSVGTSLTGVWPQASVGWAVSTMDQGKAANSWWAVSTQYDRHPIRA